MREAELTINLMKSKFSKATVKYLGYIVGQGQVRPLDAKIQTITKFPITTSRKEFSRNCCSANKFVKQKGENLSGQMIVNWLFSKITCFEKSRL